MRKWHFHEGGRYHTEIMLRKSMDWFLYDNGRRHEGVKHTWLMSFLLFDYTDSAMKNTVYSLDQDS